MILYQVGTTYFVKAKNARNCADARAAKCQRTEVIDVERLKVDATPTAICSLLNGLDEGHAEVITLTCEPIYTTRGKLVAANAD